MMEADKSKGFTKEQIQKLLKGKFGPDVTVSDVNCHSFTAAGDNYGSTLIALDINILNNNLCESLNLIAKLLPPTDFLREVFNVESTFCKEINLYKLVYPALLEMQYECEFHENEIKNLVPGIFGHWTSNEKPEGKSSGFEAVLLLENLKVCNYKVADRISGLDLNHCQLVMRNLASFHALTVGLRERKPAIYEKTVLKATGKFHLGPIDVDEAEERRNFVEDLRKKVPECRSLVDKIMKCILSHKDFENVSLAKEPFATLVHNDLWTNNVLFKYKDKPLCKEPCDIKFIDFQTTLCCSPARDIVFFLYSSAQTEVINHFYDSLIDLYYESFISLLKKLKCNVTKFSKSALLEEINIFAPTQVFHILFMLGMIYAPKETSEDLSNLTSKEQVPQIGETEVLRKRIFEIVNDFDKKGWLRETSELSQKEVESKERKKSSKSIAF